MLKISYVLYSLLSLLECEKLYAGNMLFTFQGNKPDFHNAMPGDKSKEFYEKFLQLLREQYNPEKIKGRHMTCSSRHFIS